jgi:hypothetical protein
MFIFLLRQLISSPPVTPYSYAPPYTLPKPHKTLLYCRFGGSMVDGWFASGESLSIGVAATCDGGVFDFENDDDLSLGRFVGPAAAAADDDDDADVDADAAAVLLGTSCGFDFFDVAAVADEDWAF